MYKPMKNKTEKSIGIRVSSDSYDKILAMCDKLGGIPVNNFAQNSIEAALQLLEQTEPEMPKWIAVGRYALDFKKGDEIK